MILIYCGAGFRQEACIIILPAVEEPSGHGTRHTLGVRARQLRLNVLFVDTKRYFP